MFSANDHERSSPIAGRRALIVALLLTLRRPAEMTPISGTSSPLISVTNRAQRAATSVQRPATSYQLPASSYQRLQRPASSVQRPAPSVQRPAPSAQRPASSVQRPATSDQRPAPSGGPAHFTTSASSPYPVRTLTPPNPMARPALCRCPASLCSGKWGRRRTLPPALSAAD